MDSFISKKREIASICIYMIISCIAVIVAVLAKSENFIQLDALNDSTYRYAEITGNPIGKDDYYVFDTNIDFYKGADDRKYIGGNIIMQVNNSHYSTDVAWNAKHLNRDELAISGNIARKNNIGVGDYLWSKNVVSDKVCKYVVRQIIPRVSNISLIDNTSYGDGIIIMGYDCSFCENISHKVLAYVKNSSNAASLKMIYRYDEITDNIKQTMPYVGVSLIIVIILTVIYVVSLKEDLKMNFRRRIAIGVVTKILDRTYAKEFLLHGIPAILMAFLINIVFLAFYGYGKAELVYLFLCVAIEVIALIISFRVAMKDIWRNE